MAPWYCILLFCLLYIEKKERESVQNQILVPLWAAVQRCWTINDWSIRKHLSYRQPIGLQVFQGHVFHWSPTRRFLKRLALKACGAQGVHSKNKAPVLGKAIPVLGVKLKRGVVRILVIFLHRPCSLFSHINGKLSPRPFEWYGWT